MSDSDQEELPNNGWFDSESDLPGISLVDSTQTLGVTVSSPSANRHIRALDFPKICQKFRQNFAKIS